MAASAIGGTIAGRVTRVLTAGALVCMYLFGAVAATGAALDLQRSARGGAPRLAWASVDALARPARLARAERVARAERLVPRPSPWPLGTRRLLLYIHGMGFCGR